VPVAPVPVRLPEPALEAPPRPPESSSSSPQPHTEPEQTRHALTNAIRTAFIVFIFVIGSSCLVDA
jgi:hypothetical protein